MVVPGISNPFFPLLVEAVERRLSADGRELLLCDSQNDPDVEAARVDALLDRRVDGLLFVPCAQQASAETLRRACAQTRVVQLDRYVDREKVDFVGVDNRAGIAQVVDHLGATGCESLVFVSSTVSDSSADQRLRAFEQVVRSRFPQKPPDVLLGDYSLEWGRDAARQVLARPALPDAVVCGADVIALGVMATMSEAGAAVPEQISVTGFDNIAFAAISSPPLTTVHQPTEAIGAMAVQLLYEALAGFSEPRHVTLSPRLIERGSTGPVDVPAEAPGPGS
jgi:LacI family transcriptional regulator